MKTIKTWLTASLEYAATKQRIHDLYPTAQISELEVITDGHDYTFTIFKVKVVIPVPDDCPFDRPGLIMEWLECSDEEMSALAGISGGEQNGSPIRWEQRD